MSSALDDFHQLVQARGMAVCMCKMLPYSANDVRVVLWAANDVEHFFLRVILRQHKLERMLAVYLLDVRLVEHEQRDSVRGGGLKEPRSHKPKVLESGSKEYRIKGRLTHPIDHAFESD